MKTPRRNFVVEYKINRRQAQAGSRSIWGNLDLEAVARQVEADNILVDAARLVPRVTNNGKAPIAAIAPSQHSQAPVEDHSHAFTALTADGDDGVSQEERPQQRPALEVPEMHDDRPIERESAPSSMRKKEKPSPEKTVARGGPDIYGPPNSRDELHALEEENRRLKRLMIIKLRQENAELRSMLKRFDAE